MTLLGPKYDRTWIDAYGVRVYERNRAKGIAEGPARWSDLDDVNPSCGHHLASYCRGCNVCLTCDGCYCREAWDW